MVRARFINDTTRVNVRAEQTQTSVRVRNAVTHDSLDNRDLPDQHPINAITNLSEVLEDLRKSFVFEQGLASSTWVVIHNLNKYPSVVVVDSSNRIQIPDDIIYDSENQITLTFLAPFAGKVFIN